jgi:hypothetical protein
VLLASDLLEALELARALLASWTFSTELLESESSEELTTTFFVGLDVFPILCFRVLD